MRELNKKQKKVIENYVDINGIDNLSPLYQMIDNIHDYETSWSDTQRYAEDYYWTKKDKEIEKKYCYTSPNFGGAKNENN